MNELKDFIEISKYAGERFDIVQAGGGNSSVKNDDGTMFIKASGVYLSEIDENYGYCIVKNKDLIRDFNNNIDINVSEYNLSKKFRPSIETLLHSLLKKYTLHSHPVVVNSVCLRKDWKELLKTIFFSDNILLVEYKTPGISLAKELKHQLSFSDSNIIFLQNHGLIVTSDNKEDIVCLEEYVINKIENYLNINIKDYKLTNEVSKLINNIFNMNICAYLCQDKYLEKYINSNIIYTLPFCPDKMVYCSVCALNLDINPQKAIIDYKENYNDFPKVIVYKNNLFFIAKNIKKAKEIEEVFKFHIMSLNLSNSKEINYLSDEEIKYIGNWEAEKYRQRV